MRWVRVPTWLKWLMPQLIWDLPSTDKIVYLTFDDGPTPSVTERVLALLHDHGAKATFFCLGRNIDLFPKLFEKIKSEGHSVGSHGYDHLDGFKTSNSTYFENARKGIHLVNTNLYRPPYGRITPFQIHTLKPFAKIVMWSAMSMDFDKHIEPESCLNYVVRNIYPGTILVFHDTEKAAGNLFHVLPRLLVYLNKHGYKTMPLPAEEAIL